MSTRKNKNSIPKVIHQIWIGENVMPNEWIDTVKDFAKKYGYTYKLWGNDNIKTLDWIAFAGIKNTYDKMEKKSLAGCSDIIRLLALYEYGGIYIDADSVMMKPAKFNSFIQNNEAPLFYGYENINKVLHERLSKDSDPKIRNAKKYLANGLIGSIKKHPFIKNLLDKIPAYFDKNSDKEAWELTGPLFTSREYFNCKTCTDIKIYPMKYFYPVWWHNITDPKLHTKVKIPKESMLFQYGYSTNHFQMYFNNLKYNKTRKCKKNKTD